MAATRVDADGTSSRIPRLTGGHRLGRPSLLRTFTAMTRTSSCSSVREKLGVAGNAEAARVNSTTAGSPTTADGTQRPSIRSPNWSWMAAAHARHVLFAASGSEADVSWRNALPPSSFTSGQVQQLEWSAWESSR